MGIFDSSAGKKKDGLGAMQMPTLTTIPVEQVATMKQQGMSDTLIIQSLQRDGYKTHQIFDAMNQAELVSGAPRKLDDLQQPSMPGGPQVFVNPPQPYGPSGQQMPPPQPDYNSPLPADQFLPPQPSMDQGFPSFAPPSPISPGDVITADQVEEIAESIIEEKWEELAKGVGKIVEWKERTEARVNEIDARINQLQHILEDLHSALLGKLSDYDKSMTSVGTDIKAMQKVFQQMLPAFTENVNELSRLTKNLKTK